MIGKVKKFTCFFIGDEGKFLEELQKLGICEIESIYFEGFGKNVVSKEEVESRMRKIEFLKNVMVEFGEKIEKIGINEKEEREILTNFPMDEFYNQILIKYKELERRKRIIQKIEKLKEEITPFLNTEIIFSEVFSLSNFSFIVFSLPSKYRFEKQREDFYIEKIGEFQRSALYLIIFRKEERKSVEEFLKGLPSSVILSVRKWNRKIKQIYGKLEKLEEKNKEEILKIEDEIRGSFKYKKEIMVFYDYYFSLFEFLSTKEKLGVSKFVKGIRGWVCERDAEILKKTIFIFFPDSYFVLEEPKEDEDVPIVLKNNKIVEPFEVVTDLYGRPVYKNIDPTGPLSLFFAISFAFCLTDAGYGLLLIILSSILIKKFKFLPNLIKFLKLLLLCGISTLIVGALTGGWFGDTLYRLPESFNFIRTLKKFVILNPLEGNQSIIFLLIALILGYVQILWGLVLNLYNYLRKYPPKYWGEPICLLLIQILVGVIVIGFIKTKTLISFPLYLLIICFVYLMYEKAKTQKELLLKLFWAVFGVYSVISGNLLSDILSYCRLFGLGLTTSVLALVINLMVSTAKNIKIFGYLLAGILFIIGHFGNLLINLLGSYVHTSRLQYLEFFTKFYESGGRVFKPFKEIRVFTYKT